MSLSAAAIAGLIAGGTAIATKVSDNIAERKALEAQANSNATQMAFQQQQLDRQTEAGEYAKGLYQPYVDAGQSASQRILSGEFSGPELGDFNYQSNVNDFLDPSMDYQLHQAQKAMQETSNMGGNSQSGNTYLALQNQAQDYAQTDYANAYNRMASDKSSAYQSYMDKFNAQRQGIIDNYNQIAGISSQGYNATQGQANAVMNQANQGQGVTNQLSNISSVGGNINALQAGTTPQAVSTAIQGFGQLAGTGLAAYSQSQTADGTTTIIPNSGTVTQGSV